MLFPIRCFSCGKVIGHLYDIYKRRVEAGEDPNEVLNDLGITKPCCRARFISYNPKPLEYILKLRKYNKF